MFERDRWVEVYHTLKSNKLRTLLTGFGVFWGIFMLSVMLGAGKGLQNGAFQEMGGLKTNTVFVWANRTSKAYKGFTQGRWVSFNNSDINVIRDNIPEIEYLAPQLNVETWNGIPNQSNVTRGLKTSSYEISGTYPEMFKIDPVNLVSGRLLNYYDVINARKIVIIGQKVANDLFPNNEEPVGKYVQIMGGYFLVAGVMKSQHGSGWAEEQDRRVILPFTTMQRTYNISDKVHNFMISANDKASGFEVEEKVKKILKERHMVAPDDMQAVQSFNLEKEFKMFSGLFLGIQILVWIVGCGTLLAGIVGVSNIMIVILKERTHEIGIQRAIGAHPWIIIRQIMMESLTLTFIAGYIGLVLGVLIIEGVAFALKQSGGSSPFFANPEVNFKVAVTAIFILVISGLLAGFFPARRAMKIKPVDAMREE